MKEELPKEAIVLQKEIFASFDEDMGTCLQKSRELLRVGKQRNSNYICGLAQGYIASVFLMMANYDTAICHLYKSADFFRSIQYKKGLIKVLNGLGVAKERQGDRVSALVEYYKALDYSTGGPEDANTYNNIAVVYQRQGDYDKALHFFKKAFSFLPENKHEGSMEKGFLMMNMAKIYRKKGNLKKAIQWFNEALAIAESKGVVLMKVRSMKGLGLCCIALSQQDRALAYLNQALSLGIRHKLHIDQISISMAMIQVYKAQNMHREREQMLHKIVDIAYKKQQTSILICLEAQREYYEDIKDYKQAFLTLSKYLKAKEALHEQEDELCKLQTAFEAAEKEREIECLKKQRAMEKRQKNIQQSISMLRSHLNPHFMFNTLNAIQVSIQSGAHQKSADSLHRFANFMREILRASRQSMVSIAADRKAIANYLVLEQMRSKRIVSHSVFVDENLDAKHVQVPSLLTLSFLEQIFQRGVAEAIHVIYRKGKQGVFIHIRSKGNNDDDSCFDKQEEYILGLNETSAQKIEYKIQDKQGKGLHVILYSETTNLTNGIHSTKGREIQ